MNPALRRTLDRITREFPPTPIAKSTKVRTLLRVIHESPFDSSLNARSIKARAGVADHNVATHFKLELGMSIVTYLTNLRIEVAAACLSERAASIAEIALAVGFTNLQTFYTAFKARYGTTPGAFAKRSAQQRRTDLGARRSTDARGRPGDA